MGSLGVDGGGLEDVGSLMDGEVEVSWVRAGRSVMVLVVVVAAASVVVVVIVAKPPAAASPHSSDSHTFSLLLLVLVCGAAPPCTLLLLLDVVRSSGVEHTSPDSSDSSDASPDFDTEMDSMLSRSELDTRSIILPACKSTLESSER